MKNPAGTIRLTARRAAFALLVLSIAAAAVAVFSLRWQGGGDGGLVYESAAGEVFAVFGNSFAVCSSTQLQVFDENGRNTLTRAVSAENPGLAASDTALAVWSAGEAGLLVLDAEGKASELETAGAVTDVSANELGMLAVTSGCEDYRGLVTVYDASLRTVYRWYAATAWPLAAALSPDGESLAVLAASEEGGQLRLFSLSSEEELARFTAPGEVFFDLGWTDGGLCLVSDSRAVFLDASCALTGERAFGSERLADYAIDGGCTVLALSGSDGTRLVSLDAAGEELGSMSTPRALRSLDVQKGKIAVLYSDGAAVYNKNLTERGESTEASGAAALLLRADGETVAVFTGMAKFGLI